MAGDQASVSVKDPVHSQTRAANGVEYCSDAKLREDQIGSPGPCCKNGRSVVLVPAQWSASLWRTIMANKKENAGPTIYEIRTVLKLCS